MSEKLQQEIKSIREASLAVKTALPPADLAVVLGSGLGSLTDIIEEKKSLDYSDIPHFPAPTIPGHSGKLIWGKLNGRAVYAFSGRFHYYEGHDPHTVILPVRVLHELGCSRLILTNAAGGINPDFTPGDLMIISDHINLTGYNPLRGENCDEWGPRFPDMSRMYDPQYREIAKSAAKDLAIAVQEGVYCGLSGPTFETPAEIRMLKMLGADAVGMSTVPEAIAAAHCGLPVLGLSLITNMAAGMAGKRLCGEEVIEIANARGPVFQQLVEQITAAV